MEMVEVYDEKIQRYLEKDSEVEGLLENKINELSDEKKKLSDKYDELKELESSYRDKLTRDSSTYEIRKIADEIDRIKEEVTNIQSNIDSLEIDINKTSEAKRKTEKTKDRYISNVSKTIEDYEKKLEAINKAIEICDNDSLKEAFEEEQKNMEKELTDLKTQREQELNIAIEKTIKRDIEDVVVVENKEEVKPSFDEITVSELLNKIEIKESDKTIEEPKEEVNVIIEDVKKDEKDIVPEEKENLNILPVQENEPKIELPNTAEESSIVIPEIPATNEIELKEQNIILPDIDLVNISAKLPEEKEEKYVGKVIVDNMFVDASKVSQILGSSGVMPSVYSWLSNNITEDKKVVE